jgi:threonine/homoserine/homoserine lactone efflux protein
MSLDSQVIAFAALAALLTITPGPDTMLVIRNVMAGGCSAGFMTTLGICCGLFIHATLSAAGLSLILVRSGTAFDAVKLLGAVYLMWLGLRSLKRSAWDSVDQVPKPTQAKQLTGSWSSFVEGLLSNALNPKVAMFYLAFLPQFIRTDEWIFGKSMMLAGIHFAEGILWLSVVTLSFSWFRAWINRRLVRRAIEASTGAILIVFGARLALERR